VGPRLATSASVRLRIDRRSDPVHQRSRPGPAEPRDLHVSPSGGVASPPGPRTRATARHAPPIAGTREGPPLVGAVQGNPEPGAVPRARPAALPHPDGDRQRQDVHGRLGVLPAGQAREGETHPVSRRPQQPRTSDAERVPAVPGSVVGLCVRRGVCCSAPEGKRGRPGEQGRHDDHRAALLHPEGRGGVRPGERGGVPVRVGPAARRGTRAGGVRARPSHRDLRLHRHRRVPPVDLQRLAAGRGVLRRLPDRADGHAKPADGRLSTTTSSRTTRTRRRSRTGSTSATRSTGSRRRSPRKEAPWRRGARSPGATVARAR